MLSVSRSRMKTEFCGVIYKKEFFRKNQGKNNIRTSLHARKRHLLTSLHARVKENSPLQRSQCAVRGFYFSGGDNYTMSIGQGIQGAVFANDIYVRSKCISLTFRRKYVIIYMSPIFATMEHIRSIKKGMIHRVSSFFYFQYSI